MDLHLRYHSTADSHYIVSIKCTELAKAISDESSRFGIREPTIGYRVDPILPCRSTCIPSPSRDFIGSMVTNHSGVIVWFVRVFVKPRESSRISTSRAPVSTVLYKSVHEVLQRPPLVLRADHRYDTRPAYNVSTSQHDTPRIIVF